jgi:hypothetical protein
VAEFASATSSWPTNFPIMRKVIVMLPNLPVSTHIDLARELSRTDRLHETEVTGLSSCHIRDIPLEASIPVVWRLYQSLAATYYRIRNRHVARGESLSEANPRCVPNP